MIEYVQARVREKNFTLINLTEARSGPLVSFNMKYEKKTGTDDFKVEEWCQQFSVMMNDALPQS